MGKLTISMAIFNSYFDITRGIQRVVSWRRNHGISLPPHESQEAESKKAEAKMEQMMNDMEAGAAGTAGTCGQFLRKMCQCTLW